MSEAENLKNYLVQMTDMMHQYARKPDLSFDSVEELVLKYGKAYESKPLSPEAHNSALVQRWSSAPRLKDCFRVATRFVWDLHSEGAVYVEGYASSGLIPVHHAWVVWDGAVIDLTWRRDKKGKANPHGQQFVYGVLPPNHAYYGIEIPWDLLLPSLERRRVYGFLYDMVNMKALVDRFEGQRALRMLIGQAG